MSRTGTSWPTSKKSASLTVAGRVSAGRFLPAMNFRCRSIRARAPTTIEPITAISITYNQMSICSGESESRRTLSHPSAAAVQKSPTTAKAVSAEAYCQFIKRRNMDLNPELVPRDEKIIHHHNSHQCTALITVMEPQRLPARQALASHRHGTFRPRGAQLLIGISNQEMVLITPSARCMSSTEVHRHRKKQDRL